MMVVAGPDFRLVNVVDSHPEDYSCVAERLAQDELRMQVYGYGRDALRSDANEAPDLWVINMRLPDMSGLDLMAMLRWRFPGAPMVLVNDEYDSDAEIAARAGGPDMYLCKPLEADWLMAPLHTSVN